MSIDPHQELPPNDPAPVDPTPTDPTPTESTPTAPTPTLPGFPSSDPPVQKPETDEAEDFDPSNIETTFGLPAGSLKDCKTADEALTAVRDFADKTLLAGLGRISSPPAQEPQAPANQPNQPAQPGQPTGGNTQGDDPLAKLRAEVDEIKSAFTAQREQYLQRMASMVADRYDAEMDSWNSAKYGTRDKQTYAQAKARREFQQLVDTHLAGLQATGQPVSQIETIMRRVRAYDDDTYTPGQVSTPQSQAPLGSPGGGSRTHQPGQPTIGSIHDALLQTIEKIG